MLLNGNVAQVAEDGFWVFVPATPEQKETIISVHKPSVLIEFEDGRSITTAQRKKAYVLIRCIADWWGYTPTDVIKEITKYMFAEQATSFKGEMFSLSDCTRSEARLYITFLIEFCLTHDIPCGEPLYKLCEDVPRYVWYCLIKKRCAVCGRKSELHHVDGSRVQMGRNRKEICHIGMEALPLCREHHIETHNMGDVAFMEKYHIEPVKIDERIAEANSLRG